MAASAVAVAGAAAGVLKVNRPRVQTSRPRQTKWSRTKKPIRSSMSRSLSWRRSLLRLRLRSRPRPNRLLPVDGDVPRAQPKAVTVTTPEMIVVPTTYSLPSVTPAPMPIDQLHAVLQQAGLSLVQTEPGKFSETQARLAAEPRPVRVPRERPQLPPLDEGPLIQVETRPGQSPSA